MKTINKNNWMYKLIMYTFESRTFYKPTNTCSFYWNLFLSIMLFPMLGALELIFRCGCLDMNFKKKEDNKQSNEIVNDTKWEHVRLSSVFFIFIIFIAFWINIGIANMFHTTISSALMCVIIYPSTLLYAAIVGLIVRGIFYSPFKKSYKELKSKICKPIQYLDDQV